MSAASRWNIPVERFGNIVNLVARKEVMSLLQYQESLSLCQIRWNILGRRPCATPHKTMS
jgi:hypothetical protein